MAESYIKKVVAGGIELNLSTETFPVSTSFGPQNISAGTFVNYGVSSGNPSLATNGNQFIESNQFNGISSISLGNNKFLFLDTKNTAKLKIGTISGDTIVFGTNLALSSGSPTSLQMVKLEKNKVAIAFYKDNKSFIKIATIDNDTITLHNEYEFHNSTASTTALVALDSNRVFVVFRDQQDNRIGKALIATVNNTVVSFGNKFNVPDTSMTFNASLSNKIVADKLTNSKVVLAWNNSGPGRNVIATIQETTISFGSTGTYLAENCFNSAVVAVNERFFISFCVSTSNQGYAIPALVEGSFIRYGAGSSNNMFKSASSIFFISAVLWRENNVFFAYRYLSGSNTVGELTSLSAFISGGLPAINISSTKSVFSNDSANNIHLSKINNSKLAVFFSTNSEASWYRVINHPKFLVNTTTISYSQGKVFGLAKTSGSAGENVEVYVNG
jgi:hypothetical protein